MCDKFKVEQSLIFLLVPFVMIGMDLTNDGISSEAWNRLLLLNFFQIPHIITHQNSPAPFLSPLSEIFLPLSVSRVTVLATSRAPIQTLLVFPIQINEF